MPAGLTFSENLLLKNLPTAYFSHHILSKDSSLVFINTCTHPLLKQQPFSTFLTFFFKCSLIYFLPFSAKLSKNKICYQIPIFFFSFTIIQSIFSSDVLNLFSHSHQIPHSHQTHWLLPIFNFPCSTQLC